MLIEAINEVKQFLVDAKDNPEKYFERVQDFTRNRKLNFQDIALSLVNLPKYTLSAEIENLLERLGRFEEDYSKSAYSQSREKLKPIFFQDWSAKLVEVFFKHPEAIVHRWKGLRPVGVDGSKLYLINNEEVTAYFGTQSNQHGEQAMGLALVAYDVLNEFCLHSSLAKYRQGEAQVASAWMSKLQADMLMLYDRLFPSNWFIYEHIARGIPFLMRCKLKHNNVIKNFVASGEKELITHFTINSNTATKLRKKGYTDVKTGEKIKVRLLRIILDTGEVEVLVTSLYDQQQYPHSDFKPLYFLRWGSETAYDRLKNQLQIEIFSGQTVRKIKQEFYATIFTYNLLTLFVRSLDKKVAQKNETRKHRYQINRNVGIGILKGRLITLFMNPVKPYIELLQHKIFKNLTEDKKGLGMNNPRNKKAHRINGKYQTYLNFAKPF